MNFNLIPPVRSLVIRRAASGQPCTAGIAGVCRNDTSTTVLCHFQEPGHGSMGGKCSDMSAGFCCMACHDVLDMRDNRWPDHLRFFEYYKRRSINRTLHMLWEDGLVQFAGGGRDKGLDDPEHLIKAPGLNLL